MNPLLKELANRALKQPDTDNDGLTVFDNDELTKFAELLVKECTVIMHKDTSPNCPYVDYFKVTNEIKQHFGVK